MGRYDEALATAEQASDDTPELSPGQSAALSRSARIRGGTCALITRLVLNAAALPRSI